MRGLDGAAGAVGFQLGSSSLACSADIMLLDEGQPSEKVRDEVCAGVPKTLILAALVFIV